MSQRRTCKISGCNRPVYARGMCAMHYQKWWRKKHPRSSYQLNKNWRLRYPDRRNLQKQRNYQKGSLWNTNSGKPYDDIEIAMIIDKTLIDNKGNIIKENATDREIAQCLSRTVRAIQAQRCRWKKMLKLKPKRPKK